MKSDGSTADYYRLPEGATELQHLISHRNLNAQDGEMFRAIYRKGRASHSDELRDAKKVLFYAQAEVDRLEKLQKPIIHELYTEATEERMDVVGQNGNTAEHYACTACYGSGRITKAFGSETCNACFGAAAGRTNDLR